MQIEAYNNTPVANTPAPTQEKKDLNARIGTQNKETW